MRDPRARGRLPRGPNSHVESSKVSDSATAFKQGAMEAPEDDGKENALSRTPGPQPADSGQAKAESAFAVAIGKPEAAAAVAPAVSAIDASRRLPGEHYVTQEELRTTQTQNLIFEMEESEIELQQAENFTPLEATQNFALEAAVAATAVGEQNFTHA